MVTSESAAIKRGTATPAEYSRSLPILASVKTDERVFTNVELLRFNLMPQAFDLPGGWHHRVVLNLAGRALIERTRDGRHDRAWSDAGCASIIQAGTPVSKSVRSPVDFLVVYIAPTVVDEVAATVFNVDRENVSLLETLAVPDATTDRLCRLLLTETRAQMPGSHLLGEILARALAMQLLRVSSDYAGRSASKPSPMPPWRMRRVTEFMEANLAEDLSLASLAEVAGVSPSQFARSFRSTSGESSHRFLLQLRMKKARHLLEQTVLSVPDVAMRCGFRQATYFSTVFRRLTGFSPRDYRMIYLT